jgi:hypothetical protein
MATKEYTSEQFWKLYKDLPQELKDAVSAEETGDYIYEACKRNDVLDNLDDIVKYVGQVLIGVLPLDEFQTTLEKKLSLNKTIAKKIVHEINRFVFYPVKEFLGPLHSTEITPPAKMKVTPPPQEKSPTPPAKGDVYREAIE